LRRIQQNDDTEKETLVPNFKPLRNIALATLAAGPLASAMATNGYFSNGYGMKALGMGGASVAMTDNAFAGANNPATAAFAGNRMDVGLNDFMPNRSGSVGSTGTSSTSDSTSFLIPEFGYNRALNDRIGVNLTVYGNGGMNTNYPKNTLTGAAGSLGVDLTQMILAPTVAYKVSGEHSFGVSPLLIQQMFKADGVAGFANYSSNTSALSNNGYDSSSGLGVRLGYLGKLSNAVSVGASYSPQTTMSKFSKYSGLFANQGSFDIPENYTAGVAIQATPDMRIAMDYQFIRYSGVAAVGDTSTSLLSGAKLGSNGGPGFGWTDVNVWKLGVEWNATPAMVMRTGINVGDNPVTSRNVTMNVLAPGVTTTHFTLGGTYALSPRMELTFAYMYAPQVYVTGPNLFAGGTTDTISMSQQSFGLQFGWKY
jgi:long-chain fatty acid transport protein